MPVTFNSKSEEVGGSSLDLIITDNDRKCSETSQTSVWRTGPVAVLLGLLCLLLVMNSTSIVQSVKARSLQDQLHMSRLNSENLSSQWDQLQTNFNNLSESRDQLQTNFNKLSESRDQLETELKSMTEERDALRNETEQLKIIAGNVSEEMKLLQSQYNSVAAARDALQTEVTELKASVQLCKRQWVRFNNKCYYFSGEVKSWHDSKQDCENRGGLLAMVTTQEEVDLLGNVYVDTWIGLSNSVTEGRWKWVDGTILVGNGFWKPGKPNNSGNGEDCAHVRKRGKGPGGWNNNDCNWAMPYVCEA